MSRSWTKSLFDASSMVHDNTYMRPPSLRSFGMTFVGWTLERGVGRSLDKQVLC